MQSPSPLHDVLHAVVPQTYAPQLDVVPAVHAPPPLQTAAVVWLPALHVADVHVVLEPG
jgi:hypothetical protein